MPNTRCGRARRVAAMMALLDELAELRVAVFGPDDEAAHIVDMLIALARYT